MENDKLKYTLTKQLKNIRTTISNNYDDILNDLERFKDELFIKDLRFSQLMDDMCLIKAENEEKNCTIQMLQEKYSEFAHEYIDVNLKCAFDDSQNTELYEGKLLILEQINQLNGSYNAEAENYRLPDLINLLVMLIFDKEVQLETLNTESIHIIQEQNQQLIKEIDDHKEWQKHLEYENEKLNYDIEHYKQKQNILMSKDNEHNDLKEDYLKIQYMYDELSKENAQLKIFFNEYQNRLNEKEFKCDDSDHLIKILKSNITEQVDKTKQAISMYDNEKEKCQRIESHTQQMIEEFTVRIHEKNIDIQSMQDESCTLKDLVASANAEIENLKQNISALDYAIVEKNKTIKDLVKYKNKQQFKTTPSLEFNELIHILNCLNQQMDTILGDLCTYKIRIVNYENVLYNMQNTIQQQFQLQSYLKTKQFSKNLIKEKEMISLQHQKEIDIFKNEIENLKREHQLKITNLVDSEAEIQHLKEHLKLKSSQIIMAEKIASSQLKEAYNIIERLIRTQSLEFDQKGNKNSEMHHHNTHESNTGITDYKFQQIECLIDLMQKLKLEKKALQKVCQIRDEKIKYLESCRCSCLTVKIKF